MMRRTNLHESSFRSVCFPRGQSAQPCDQNGHATVPLCGWAVNADLTLGTLSIPDPCNDTDVTYTCALLYTTGVGSENWTKRWLGQVPAPFCVCASLIGRRWGFLCEASTLWTATAGCGRPTLRGALGVHSSAPSSFIGTIVRIRSNPRLARRSRHSLHNNRPGRPVQWITTEVSQSFVEIWTYPLCTIPPDIIST